MAPKRETKEKAKDAYLEARGGRKTSVARVRLVENASGIVVNGTDYARYFPMAKHQTAVQAPLVLIGGADMIGKRGVSAHVTGGGVTGQAEAIRHGLARALTLLDPSWRAKLKVAGFLKRDPRAVERKKYGLKKARKSPQWSKR
jgi:small subunit ribosomal protein S9